MFCLNFSGDDLFIPHDTCDVSINSVAKYLRAADVTLQSQESNFEALHTSAHLAPSLVVETTIKVRPSSLRAPVSTQCVGADKQRLHPVSIHRVETNKLPIKRHLQWHETPVHLFFMEALVLNNRHDDPSK